VQEEGGKDGAQEAVSKDIRHLWRRNEMPMNAISMTSILKINENCIHPTCFVAAPAPKRLLRQALQAVAPAGQTEQTCCLDCNKFNKKKVI
jgi:hypothetical protein